MSAICQGSPDFVLDNSHCVLFNIETNSSSFSCFALHIPPAKHSVLLCNDKSGLQKPSSSRLLAFFLAGMKAQAQDAQTLRGFLVKTGKSFILEIFLFSSFFFRLKISSMEQLSPLHPPEQVQVECAHKPCPPQTFPLHEARFRFQFTSNACPPMIAETFSIFRAYPIVTT